MTEYEKKIEDYIIPVLNKIPEPQIFEMGVRAGISTKQFLNICEQKKGSLYSIDIDDCSKISNSPRWKFLQERDDNFEKIFKFIPPKVDIIYLDTVHEADHVEKIFYKYFEILKLGGYFIIDDISHLPYTINKNTQNFYCEINNRETFERLLEIYDNNSNLFTIEFKFYSSGLAIIKKLSENKLNKNYKVKYRFNSFKNIIRILWKKIKIKNI